MITTRNGSSLIQHHGGAELPCEGLWTLHRASFIGLSTPRP